MLRLDLTDSHSMHEAVNQVVAEHGAVGALINNAGYGLCGTVEETPVDAARRQHETNLFGPAELARLVLPGMRSQQYGTIVNVSSFFGRFGTAGRGYYQASKHGLEALSDALRLELASQGIRVVVVQPGPTFSNFVDSSAATLDESAAHGHYAEFWTRFDAFHDVYRHPERPRSTARLAVYPEDVAKVVERLLDAKNPAPRRPVGLLAHLLLLLNRTLPARAFDRFTRSVFPTP